MDREGLKAQLKAAVRTEAFKDIDEAIERLRELRAEYIAAEVSPVDNPVKEALFSPQEQRTQETRKPDFWSPERMAARSQTQQERREREKQEPKQLEPKTCMVCRQEFTPTHHLQKKCESCRTAAAAQATGTRSYEPRNCKDCGKEFIPTDGRQKTCLEHRTSPGTAKKINAINLDAGLTPEEKEWKRYGESVASKLPKRPDAPVMPGRN